MATLSSRTHEFIDVSEIKENTVVLNSGSIRAILMVSSINFDLKATEERQSLIASFQRFLNSLDYTVQIIVQSRPLQLGDYFAFLKEIQEKQENELLKIQTSEYLDFVRELVKLSNIMSKFFYVVVPYNVAVVEKVGFLKRPPGFGKKQEDESKKGPSFAIIKDELMLRVGQIAALLSEMGLRAILLQDQELVELLYGLYNPGVLLKQKNLEVLVATGEKEKQVEED